MEIQQKVFYDCNNLNDVYCNSQNVPPTSLEAFDNLFIVKATLHVPSESIDQYKTTEPWNLFGNIVSLDSSDPDPSTGILNINKTIPSNNQYYNLKGNKESHPTKGIYIINGQKKVFKNK